MREAGQLMMDMLLIFGVVLAIAALGAYMADEGER